MNARAQNYELIAFDGSVELAKTDSTIWRKLTSEDLKDESINLNPGDKLRIGSQSKATLKRRDEVITLDADSSIDILPARSSEEKSFLQLLFGRLFFFSREAPQGLRIESRTTSAAIRGTELVMESDVGSGRTKVALLEGEVDLFGKDFLNSPPVVVTAGEEATVEALLPPVKSPAIEPYDAIQWVLYYPAVLNVADLEPFVLRPSWLEESIRHYQTGDFQAALEFPEEIDVSTMEDSPGIYIAALLLATGDVDTAKQLLLSVTDKFKPSNETEHQFALIADALLKLVAAVNFKDHPNGRAPETSTEWLAESYYRQSKGDLNGALQAARMAVSRDPAFGFAWVRLAEMEFSFRDLSGMRKALAPAEDLSPNNPSLWTLKGFLAAANNELIDAQASFERALGLNSGMGDAWLGLGLTQIRRGAISSGLDALLIAAAREPRRSLLRSYLGKAFYLARDEGRADHELELAKSLDPGDPTPWLYSALMKEQQNEVNAAIEALEKSKRLNDNRRIYRSRLLLEEDRAVRGANLANLYEEAGLSDYGFTEAVRAVHSDYANFSGHLFLADAYNARRDPNQINLRYESPWLTEYLTGNLLAPVGSTTLPQSISRNEYSNLFARDRFGLLSATQYYSNGDWIQSASQYGNYRDFAYALDANYRSIRGQRVNQDLEQATFSGKFKAQLTPSDQAYFQAIYYDAEGGDVSPFLEESLVQEDLRFHEKQEPIVLAGYHHEWAPGVHSLVLGGRLQDRFHLTDPEQTVSLVEKNARGEIISYPIYGLPTAPLDYKSEFEAYTVEAQQIWRQPKQTIIGGALYQTGTFNLDSSLDASTSVILADEQGPIPFPLRTVPIAESLDRDMERVSVYAYAHWNPFDSITLTLGATYDDLTYPMNFRAPPLSPEIEETHVDRLSPKLGFLWNALPNLMIRGAYARSLSGVSFDQSFRLEPPQVAGFTQSFRNVIPESLFGPLSATHIDSTGFAVDYQTPWRTYITLEVVRLSSQANRNVGTFIVQPDLTQTTSSIRQRLDYVEDALALTVRQLHRDEWTFGAGYRFKKSEVVSNFRDLNRNIFPGTRSLLNSDIHNFSLFAQYRHKSGFFANIRGNFTQYDMNNPIHGQKKDNFLQLDSLLGFEFANQRAVLSFGVLNITDTKYENIPLNEKHNAYHSTTFLVSLDIEL